MKKLYVEIEEDLHVRLKMLAARKSMPIKYLVPLILEKGLEKYKNEEGKNEGGGKNVEKEEEGRKDDTESPAK